MGQAFFENNRRKIEMLDWTPLMNAQQEKRIRFDFLMPLTGENVLGMPDFVAPAFERMDVEESPVGEIDLLPQIEGVCFEAFSTDSNKHAIQIETLGLDLPDVKKQLGRSRVKLTNSTLRDFKIVRVSRNKDQVVALKFRMTVKADAGTVLWAYHYQGATFWAAFEHSTVPMVPQREDRQLKLGEGEGAEEEAADKGKSNGRGKNPSIEDCPYARGGEKCILNADHDGAHEMAPITQDVTAGRKSKTQKERDAVASGKPRGFSK